MVNEKIMEQLNAEVKRAIVNWKNRNNPRVKLQPCNTEVFRVEYE